MAKAASRAASTTTLKIGQIEVPVGLFATVDKPGKLAEFTTAGPNGGVLKAEFRARAVPVTELREDAPEVPVHSSDPFADEASRGLGEPWSAEHPLHAAAVAAGDPVAVDAGEMADTVPPEGFVLPDRLLVTTGHPDMERRALRELPDGRVLMGYDAPRGRDARLEDEPLSAQLREPTTVDGEYGRVLVEDGTGEVVMPDQVRRGVRLEDGRFVDCTARLAEIETRTRLDRMEVVRFVDVTRVPRIRARGAQYIGAGDAAAAPALRLLFEGLKATRRAAVVKVTKRTRQTLGVISVFDGVLVLFELTWSEDVRPAPARARSIESAAVSERQVEHMVALIDAMSVPVDTLNELRDDAIALRDELYREALSGELASEVVDAEVIDPADEIVRQLEASLAAVSR